MITESCPTDTAEQLELFEFEGMKLSKKEVEAIQARRAAAQDIKDGIDIEHINNWDDLVLAFKIAHGRAEARRPIDQVPALD